ncbi:MAG: division/cell wall cluster transcriptional repressor MraZ [Gammaproteobacteria bacterium]
MFLGAHTLNVDAKGRIAVPARFRERLSDLCGGKLVITVNIDIDTPSLLVYPHPEFQRIEAALRELPTFDKKSQVLNYLIIGHAHESDMDSQGRLLLPQTLREHAGLDKQAVLIGQSSKFEIWQAEAWHARREQMFQEAAELRSNPSDALRQLAL